MPPRGKNGRMGRLAATLLAACLPVAVQASPAATVVLLRDAADGLETLMLHRTSKVAFGGMWVFPGGRVDDTDRRADDADDEAAARRAAVREAAEECALLIEPHEVV